MKLARIPARIVRGFFGLLVRINPFSRLDTYFLRHAPIIWRTQVFLVSSYALLVFFLLRWDGRSARYRTIDAVPTEAELALGGWLTLFIALVMLAPWIYRNFQTQLERARPRDIALLFGTYCLCFYSLSLVPTAYTCGAVEALTNFPVRSATIDHDSAVLDEYIQHGIPPSQASTSEYTNLSESNWPFYFSVNSNTQYISADDAAYTRPAFNILNGIYSRYGYMICIDAAVPKKSSDDDERSEQKRACGPVGVAKVIRLADSLVGTVDFSTRLEVRINADSDADYGPNIAVLRGKLGMVSLGQHPAQAWTMDWYRPLSVGRLVAAFALAFLATLLSCRTHLAPWRQFAFPSFRRSEKKRPKFRRSALRSRNRFRLSPDKSITLRYVVWPYYLASTMYFSLSIGTVTIFYLHFADELSSSGSGPLLIFVGYLPHFLAWIICFVLAVCGMRQMARAYALFTVEDLLGFGSSYYRPGIFVVLITAITGIASYGFINTGIEAGNTNIDEGDISFVFYFTTIGSLVAFLMAYESIWLFKMLSSIRAAKLLSSSTIRWSAVFGYFILSLIAGYIILVAPLAIFSIALETTSKNPTSYTENVDWIMPTAIGLLFFLGIISFCLWYLRLSRFGLIVDKLIFSSIVAAQLLAIVIICSRSISLIGGAFYRSATGSAILFLLILVGWFLVTGPFTIRPFYRRWAQAIHEPADA